MKMLEEQGAVFTDNAIEPRPFCPPWFDDFFEAYGMLLPSSVDGLIPLPAIESYLRLFPQPNNKLFIKVINAICLEVISYKEVDNG